MSRRRWIPSIGGLVWVAVWTFPLLTPLSTIGQPGIGRLAAAGLATFAVLYSVITSLGFDDPEPSRVKDVGYVLVAALGLALAGAYGSQWLVVLVFVGACGTAVYAGVERPVRAAVLLAAVLTAMIVVGLLHHVDWVTVGANLVGAALTSGLVGAVRQLHRLVRELHRTREALAVAAVAEERLRFSRDLHDLLGHTLSVIVVKSEVVRRLAERDPAAAAAQAADIEQIGRRALVEIREAVTGYRETAEDTGSLTAELTRARGALSAAGITAKVLRSPEQLPAGVDRLLAWVVREATTNVVRHSGASTCDISLAADGGAARLVVHDNGAGDAPGPPGNGLRGLTERLKHAGGTLTAGAGDDGGFRLVAELPLAGQ